MSTDRLNVESNERIDIEDFRFLSGEGVQANLRQIGHKFFMEESAIKPQDQTGYILGGFKIENLTLKQLKVSKGKALLSQRLNGTVVRGIVTTEGDDEIIEDLNTYAYGTYRIYIRFEEISADTKGRIFWNPTGDGNEYTDEIPTRFQARWSMRVESASPGSEWLKIGEVVVSVSATLAITDQRPFYYEGSATDAEYLSGWGSVATGGASTDRNADRATYGVTDLHTFTRATRQCIEDIKGRGLRRWWDPGIGGMNIGFDDDPVEGHLAVGDEYFHLEKSGYITALSMGAFSRFIYVRDESYFSFEVEGSTNTKMYNSYTETRVNIVPKDTDAVSLGTVSQRWSEIYGMSMNLNRHAAAISSVLNLKCNASNTAISIMEYQSGVETFQIGVDMSGSLIFEDSGAVLRMALKDDGTLKVGTHSAVTTETISGYITIEDIGGTTRKLAVIS